MQKRHFGAPVQHNFFYIRHIKARHLIQANLILFLSLDNGLEINSRLGHYKIHT